ncbi:MAG: methyltransferase domain-containing protein [Boseongicola sp.]|nr:methyltransferase domain-containing protein [Boseongicola sp.]MDD9978950.1 methyltransferase domain-containing protein [Boseongicola sp.]
MTNEDDAPAGLWTQHSVEETQKIYADWADTYDQDVAKWGYATPGRIALALRLSGANPDKPTLDFGCGTGLSGLALKAAGFAQIDGTDISPEMLEKAEAHGIYQHLWLSEPGQMGHVKRGDYPIIVATGVISLGAAPPETLDMLLDVLPSGGHLAFSYNEATMSERSYTDKLDVAVLARDIELVFEEEGPHLPAKNMSSVVYILKRT